MEVIKWSEIKPTGQHQPAADGDLLDGLIQVRIFWDNKKSHFEVSFCGNRYQYLPEHFDTLKDAKEYAEKEALSMLLGATEENNPDHLIIRVIAPGNLVGREMVSTKFHYDLMVSQALGRVDDLIRRLVSRKV